MALTPKPFNRSEKIDRPIHRGRPNLFNTEDVNKHFSILKDSADMLWKLSGTVYNNPFTNTSFYDPTSADKLNIALSWTAFSVVSRSMSFDIPAGNFAAVTAESGFPGIRIHLVATKALQTFVTNPALCGVSGGSLPSAMAGSDVETFSNERLVYSVYPAAPALNPGEEIIAKIATIIPYKNSGYFDAKLYSLTNSAYSKLLTDIVGEKFGDDISLVEMNQYVLDFFLSYLTDPVGVWKGYHGVITGNFDGTGLGLNKFAGWALMNGANGTPDFRDRTPMGYDPRTIDPGNTIWDAAYNVMGGVGGEKKHQLSAAELPRHSLELLNSSGTPYYHDGPNQGNSGYSLNGDNNNNSNSPIKTSFIGNDEAHENRHPFIVTGFIMRVA